MSSTSAAMDDGVVTTEEGSDASSLADELGRIGLQTVGGDKIKAPVEAVDIVDDETVRLWYRFPTGELIPEEFDRPTFWDVTDSKLARVVDYAGLRAETFSQIESNDDVEIVLEETSIQQAAVDVDALTDVAPIRQADRDEETDPEDFLYLETDEAEYGPNAYVTWTAVEPRELVEDNRYSDSSSDGDEDTTGVDEDLVVGAAATGFAAFFVAGVLHWALSGAAGFVSSGLPFSTTVFIGLVVLIGAIAAVAHLH